MHAICIETVGMQPAIPTRGRRYAMAATVNTLYLARRGADDAGALMELSVSAGGDANGRGPDLRRWGRAGKSRRLAEAFE
jgi:hypothetical protein